MPFFLLARDEDDQLRLLTPDASPSRQDALAVLAKLTSDPGFDAWDAEVLLVDIDSALPVLLVRPSEGTAEIDSRVSAVALEAAPDEPAPAGDVTFMWPAPEHVSATPSAEEVVLPASQISAEEAEAFASYVSLADEEVPAEPEPVPEPEAEGGAAESESLSSAAGGEWPVPEIASELEGESAGESSVQEPASADEQSEQPGERSALAGMGVAAASTGAGAVLFPAESEPQVEADVLSPQPEPELEVESALEAVVPAEEEWEVGLADAIREGEAEAETQPETQPASQPEPESVPEGPSESDTPLGEWTWAHSPSRWLRIPARGFVRRERVRPPRSTDPHDGGYGGGGAFGVGDPRRRPSFYRGGAAA